jgi:hypothetical protein
MNIHSGKEKEGHDNCRLEALQNKTKDKSNAHVDKLTTSYPVGDGLNGTGTMSSAQGQRDKEVKFTVEADSAEANGKEKDELPDAATEDEELAHTFHEHSYPSPEVCDMCSGLLVGLWSQGLQCKTCHMNVHRGEGKEGHDNCRIEALLTACPGCKIRKTETPVGLKVAIKQLNEMAPNLGQEIRRQLNRDLMSHAVKGIVASGVEDERSKKLKRAKVVVVTFVRALDKLEARGETYTVLFFLGAHALIAGALSAAMLPLTIIALWPSHGLLEESAIHLTIFDCATVNATTHTYLVLLTIFMHHAACIFKRKASVFHNLLHEFFQIDAEADIGISVAGAALRAKAWSIRAFQSASVSCVGAVLLWHTSLSPLTPGEGRHSRWLVPIWTGVVAATVHACSVLLFLSFFYWPVSNREMVMHSQSAESCAPVIAPVPKQRGVASSIASKSH